MSSETGEGFIFDRSGSRPLLRFERREETWVLRPTAAPRGDIIYRNDAGDQVLRVTPGGGMTVYTSAIARRLAGLLCRRRPEPGSADARARADCST